MDPVDLEEPDGEECLRKELFNRGSVEFRTFSGGGGDQGRSLNKQRWLQLRGRGRKTEATMVGELLRRRSRRDQAGSVTAYQSRGVAESAEPFSPASTSAAVGSVASLTTGRRMRSMTTTSTASDTMMLTTRATRKTIGLSQG